MAEAAEFQQIFSNLAVQLTNVSNAVGTQGVGQVVAKFDGSAGEYKSWIKSIEKYALLTNLEHDRKKLIAYQTATGSVSDFIHRYLRDHADCSWDDLKTALGSRFSNIQDPQNSTYLLRNIKQKPGENVHAYVERLMILAEDAYSGYNSNDQQGNLAVIEKQLIDYFIDGLAENYLKLKVMRDSPASLQDAINSATAEQNLRMRFNLRFPQNNRAENLSKPEPMDISHIRPQRPCQYCHKLGHKISDCRSRQRHNIRAVTTDNRQPNDQPNVRYRSTHAVGARQITCWNCGKYGHIRRFCKTPIKQTFTRQSNYNNNQHLN